MATFGLTSTGFVPKRLADIVEELNAEYRAVFGPEVNLSPDGFLGRQIQAQAQALSLAWDGLAQVYSGMAPGTAQGVQLDNLCDLVGVKRKAAVASTVPVTVRAPDGTGLPTNYTVASSAANSVGFQVTPAEVTRSGGSITVNLLNTGPGGLVPRTVGARVTITQVLNSTAYTINVFSPSGQFHQFSFTSDGSATATEIRDGLAALFNATATIATVTTATNTVTFSGNQTATFNGFDYLALTTSGNVLVQVAKVASVTFSGGNTTVVFADSLEAGVVASGKARSPMFATTGAATDRFNVKAYVYANNLYPLDVVLATNTRLGSEWVENALETAALTTGPIAAPATTLTTQVTIIAAVLSVDNEVDADIGNDQESDADLRIRRLQDLTIGGVSTDDAIRAVINAIANVDNVSVTSNRSDVTDGEGRPPHSFEAVVQGGDTQTIGQAIWNSQPAGIQSYGSSAGGATAVTVQAIDTQGNTHAVEFTRPGALPVFVRVAVTADPEVALPGNYATLITDAIVAFGNRLLLGRDVVAVQFVPAILVSCPGIGTIYINVASSAPPSPPTTFNVLTVSPRQIPTFASTRVVVS